ncbi:TIGR00341 family protein [Salinadaptatus halalkaliphilus]|uniref:TIGR00341 family protein n=1 Tax=Salinadaptatus halalkaliphilus TaxID=2419781 RepID=A0A4S3TP13_9EURY|nr:TIGR00341 family protein [Salinadaptatus halalkaliphilus]THE64318.1 TIGR00341 family protein [Salinadaptatus halalkaliphilus]
MRHVEVSLRPETREPVLEVLDSERVDYTVVPTDDTSDYDCLVSFTLPKNTVDVILNELEEAGLGEDDHTVIVTADTVISRKFGAFKDRYTGTVLADERLARYELYAESEALVSTIPIYVTLTLVSAIVATAGLLLDSAAVVVGSMVIAPLIGPALAASVGTVLNEHDLFWTGVTYQVLGVSVAIAGSAVFAWLSKSLFLVPPGIEVIEIDEVSERVLPNLFSLIIAFGAGIAGVLGLSTGVSVALVGVMIAAALIPPAAAAGIAIAWGVPNAAVGSLILVFVNLLSINITGLFTLWAMGYRPHIRGETGIARQLVRRRLVVLTLVVLVLSTFLIGVTWASYERASLENDVTTEAEAVLDSPAYHDVTLVEVELFLEGGIPFEPAIRIEEGSVLEQPERIVITVEKPVDDDHPEFVSELDERITDETGYDVRVDVRFIEYHTV